MFAQDWKFAFEDSLPNLIWVDGGWRRDRRSGPGSHLGRRKNDVYFPYSPSFVVQTLAQSGTYVPAAPRLRGQLPRYADHPPVSRAGRYLKLHV